MKELLQGDIYKDKLTFHYADYLSYFVKWIKQKSVGLQTPTFN
jgi:hypothetical protein